MGKPLEHVMLHRGLGWVCTGLVLLFAIQMLDVALQMFPVTQLLEDGNAANLEPPGSLYVIPVLMLLAGASMIGRGMAGQRAAATATAESTG
ncbi:hypothetical protein [Arthrobacter sp.]|uniref:hypothetical protein n=1 Tax=Arthrobacter sp. TaxID=1667 RepID=UPI003A8E9D4F